MERMRMLYYERPELLEAEATIVAVEGESSAPVLELDQTIFYPEGGGQPCDLGSIGDVALASVSEKDGRVLHAMAGPCPVRAGDRVRLRVDGARRLDYSQAHTGQHLLSATAMRIIGAPTISAHFGKERCAIDFDVPSIPEEDMAEIEDAVERAIAEDRPIRAHLCPPEDLASFPLRKRPPVGEEVLRIVEIDGIDFTPCCGTHLSSTGRLRLVRVLGTERYKGMTRLYFLAGGRAAEDYRSVSRIAQEAARSLGISVGELGAAVSREAERRKNLEFANVALVRERAAMEAQAAASELGLPAAGEDGHPAGSPPLVSRRYPDRDAASLMETAKAFASAGMTALLASVPELTVQALSPNAAPRLGERLKPLLATAGGRGGGGAASFRAVLPDAVSLDVFMTAAAAALEPETK
jgi:alanyl-tRNA synthetase